MGERGCRLKRLLEAGVFAVSAEIGPPMGASPDEVTAVARSLRGCVDAANITDNQVARVHMSSVAASALALSQGVEPVLQMTCRDRNRIALQSDLLGAYALGVRSVLCLSGDHQSFGDHPQAKNVYDLDSVQLIGALDKLKREGVLLSGTPCDTPPDFFLGAVANPFADPPELQIMRLRKKIRAGAQFIQTQAIYDWEGFARWMELVRAEGLHKKAYILAGVLANRSAESIARTRMAPGMVVPGHLEERMKRAADAGEEGKRITLELIERLRQIEGVAGLHIMAIHWEEVVPELVSRAGLLPRPEPVGT